MNCESKPDLAGGIYFFAPLGLLCSFEYGSNTGNAYAWSTNQQRTQA